MSERVWVTHPDLKVVRQVAASAVPVLGNSGWKRMTAAEVADHEAALAADRSARIAALTPIALAGLSAAAAVLAEATDKPAGAKATRSTGAAEKSEIPEKATAQAATSEKQES